MTREITLTQGKVVLVDDGDYEWLSQWKWRALRAPFTYYAVRTVKVRGKQSTIYMHRLIMETPKNLKTDHVNGNGLDNTRANLRVCTHQQNLFNGVSRKGTSSYKGVGWYKRLNQWRAQIQVDSRQVFLGYFDNEIDAAIAYDAAAKKFGREFAALNFPDTPTMKISEAA